MKLAQIYSHLNGLEYLMVHQPKLWAEIKAVIEETNAEQCKTKESKERTRIGTMLYSPVELNKVIYEKFVARGWSERRVQYFVNEDLETSRGLIGIEDSKKQKLYIERKGFTPFGTYNQIDAVKDRVAIEIQFGKYFSVQYDLHVKHTFFFNRGDINVGVEIIPTHKMMKQMSSGIAWYENELMNIVREGRSNPSVPIVLIGIEP